MRKFVPTSVGADGSSEASASLQKETKTELRYSRSEVSGLDRLAASSGATIRSLIADVEIKAHGNGAPLQIIPLRLNGVIAAKIYCFERRLGGLRTGLHDGVVILSSPWQSGLMPWLCHRLQDFVASDLATFRIIADEATPIALEEVVIRNRNMMASTNDFAFQEILPLPESFDDFLEQFGRSTRRNVMRGLDAISGAGMIFQFAAEPHSVQGRELRRLARKNIPYRQSIRKLTKVQDFVASQPRPFAVSLRDSDQRLISAAGGFVEDGCAYLAYQANHRDYRHMNPSLSLRALLVEQLIAAGVDSLAFIGSCAGSLLRYCERVKGAELLVTRHSLLARAKHLASFWLQPKSRIGQLTEAFLAKTSAGDRPFIPEIDRFEQSRTELQRVRVSGPTSGVSSGDPERASR